MPGLEFLTAEAEQEQDHWLGRLKADRNGYMRVRSGVASCLDAELRE